jgi:phasin family protein
MVAKSKKPAAVAAAGEIADNGVLPNLFQAFPYEAFAPYGAFAEAGRDNFAALVKANGAVAEGLEALSKEVVLYTKASLDSAGQTAKALLAAKSFEDVVQVQTAFAKEAIEAFVDRSAKLSEMGLKVANDAFAPLGGRVEATLAKLGKQASA